MQPRSGNFNAPTMAATLRCFSVSGILRYTLHKYAVTPSLQSHIVERPAPTVKSCELASTETIF